jgi:hypothetical protein
LNDKSITITAAIWILPFSLAGLSGMYINPELISENLVITINWTGEKLLLPVACHSVEAFQ